MLNLLLAVVMDSFVNQVKPEEEEKEIKEVQNDPEKRINAVFGKVAMMGGAS
jgi:hypothetical protein